VSLTLFFGTVLSLTVVGAVLIGTISATIGKLTG